MMKRKDKKKKEEKQTELRIAFRMFRRNRLALAGSVVLILLILAAIFADFITPYYAESQNLMEAFQGPSALHWFGTDEFGRDIYSRVIYGTRQSLLIGFASIAIAVVVGCFIGLVSGYYEGALGSFLMRVMDIIMAIPSMLFAIAIVAALGSSLRNLLIAIALSRIPIYARLMRSSVVSVKQMEYVTAAKVMGVSNKKIILEDILPNSLSPIIVQATLGVAFAILTAAGMSFLGLGIQPPTPEWGNMISVAKTYIRDYPHMTIFPGAAIMITILSLNLMGDGLRDALDPKMRY